MHIQDDQQYRQACSRLQREDHIRSERAFTDDEQRDYDDLKAGIADYEAKARGGTSAMPAPPQPSLAPTQPTATVASAPVPSLLADNMRQRVAASSAAASRASMSREIQRAGLGAGPGPNHDPSSGISVMQTSMQRELQRQGLVPRG